jgi:gliding motility-associated lipoprotein GldB
MAGLYAVLQAQYAAKKKSPDLSGITVHLAIKRLEKVLFSLDSKEEIRAFLKGNTLFATQFLGLTSRRDEDALVEKLYAMVHNANLQALYQEVQRVFGDFSAIQQQLEGAFCYLRYYYPHFKIPQVVTFITGMGIDLHLSEDLIVVGLDFFMGEGAKFRPIELPEYLLKTYQTAYIVPKIILLLSQKFIETNDADQTLLADMLYYGKAYYFAQAMLPEVDVSVILAYTKEQLAEVENHQDVIWEHFIGQELLYVTNHLTKNNYLNDRPCTSEIGQRCPGNIGRWLGWEIVKSYMKKHAEADLPALMCNPDTQALFAQSGYRPRK